jgi:tRNA A-37 threonylcarbamoyl transferase component Bud32
MHHSTDAPAGMPASSQTITALDPAAGARPSSRPCMALVTGTGQHLTEQVHCLLRSRLRIAGLIGLAGHVVFLLKPYLFPTDHAPVIDPLLPVFHYSLVALWIVLCSVLWTQLPLGMRALRAIEYLMFGSMALFFAYMQLTVFQRGNFFSWAADGYGTRVLSLATTANTLRWFVLIVLYGAFIPNTWRRCATVVGLMALTPLVMMFTTCYGCATMDPFTGTTVFDTAVILSLASAIAIFGSYKLSSLEQQAYQARKLGQYQLHRKLGAGGMGEVFLGEHMLLKRACAIKLIHPEQAGDPVTLSRFVREVQAMATLTHWNTVEIYDYGNTADGTFYYVMEYLPGLSLQELVEQYGPLPPGRAIHFLRQICAALQEAHAIGLIHRDIKPSNVIACRRGAVYDVAKLLDFGLVHDHGLDGHDHQLTLHGAVLGSPPYISPEQARGKGHVDGRSDIYSLGGLAYYLVTGQSPFVRETAMELLVAHMHDQVAPPRQIRPELPLDLEEVILTCLRKDPAERYADVATVDRVLARCECAEQWDGEQATAWWEGRRHHVASVA